ncbi:MAG: ABC transporter substrate-binding protein, partial [Candidatus Sericytochromatia bacterium]|nr:ABC transporter substrate-binding protein [Candidatus Sericytochromatia bacterium]
MTTPSARLASLALIAILSGCDGAERSSDAVFRVGLQDEPRSLDPALGYDVASWALEHLMFESLVGYGPRSEIVPALAASWEARGDRSWVFHLRTGARFHDGRPVRASDVVATFERLLAPATRSPGASFYAAIAGAPERLAGRPAPPLGVTALDEATVRITLTRPVPVFLQLLAMPFTAVLPAGTGRDSHGTPPVGTGPFRLAAWESGRRIAFERHPHAPPPAGPPGSRPPRGVEVRLGVAESMEVLRFERGDLDVVGALRGIPAADFAFLADHPDWRPRLHRAPDAAVHYVTINTGVPPFDRREVRRAVAMAIDKRRIVRLINGRGEPAAGILPPTVPGFDASLRGLPHDPDRARTLLARAGLGGGFEATYACVANDTQRKVAQAIQQDLAGVGIRLTIKPMALPTYLQAKSTRGQVAIGSGNWSQDYPDPGNFLTTMFHGKNVHDTESLNDSFYENPVVDALLDRAEASVAPADRARLFRQAEAIIIEDAPAVPLYHPVKYHLPGRRVV